jgi:hypothetical protein
MNSAHLYKGTAPLVDGAFPRSWTRFEDLQAVDVRLLRRRGHLRPGAAGWLSWSRGGVETGRVRFAVGADAVVLEFGPGEVAGVRLLRAPQHYGGERLRFACPACGRRCEVVYRGDRRRLGCYACSGLRYASEADEAEHERLLRRVQTIRGRLGGPEAADLSLPFPPKPKWMRWTTYHRLRATAEELEQRMWEAADEYFAKRMAGRL